MPCCVKCGHIFVGVGLEGSPYQNMITGQWICYKCYERLAYLDQNKYILI